MSESILRYAESGRQNSTKSVVEHGPVYPKVSFFASAFFGNQTLSLKAELPTVQSALRASSLANFFDFLNCLS